MVKISKEAALEYHESGRPGKIEVKPTKAYRTQTDLSLAYSPGVAYPCLEIQQNPDDAYKYTDKGNLVAVISNGTAVLGLGDIGAMSGKPVMEGKGLLFKIYGGIDVFDIEVDEKDPDVVRARNEISEIAENTEYVLQIHGFYLDKVKKFIKFDVIISFDADDRNAVYQDFVKRIQNAYPDYTIIANQDTDFSVSE